MLHRLLMTFLVVFFGASLLGAVWNGGGGVVSTTLSEDITANSTTLLAPSTGLFPDADIIQVGSERMLYSSKNATAFFIQTRGYEDTEAETHSAGRRIYSSDAGVLNTALGFNLAVEAETGGTWGVIMLPINFFTKTLPHMIQLNVGFLQTPELSIIGIAWLLGGIALIVVLAIEIAPVAVGLISGLFGIIRR